MNRETYLGLNLSSWSVLLSEAGRVALPLRDRYDCSVEPDSNEFTRAAGRARDRHVTHAYRARHRGTQIRRSVGARPYAARRRRSQACRGHRPDAGLGLERVAGAHHRRGARLQPPALDLQEREQSHRRVAGARACGGSSRRQRAVAPPPLHAAGDRKSTEGTQQPDRDAQFNYLNEQVRGAQEQAIRSFQSTPRRRN